MSVIFGDLMAVVFVYCPGKANSGDLMLRFDDLLRISFRQVFRQRRRNLGAALAIALGTAGFIVIITTGQDVKENINRDLELLGGATRIRTSFENHLKKYSFSRPQWFRKTTINALRRIPGVTGVSLTAWKGGDILYTERRRPPWVKLMGVDEYYWDVNSFHPVRGRFFGPEEIEGRAKVCVLGKRLVRRIFSHEKIVGQLINIDHDHYRVIGVLGGLGIGDRADAVFIPLTTAQDRIKGLSHLNTVYIRCHTWDDVESVAGAIPGVIQAHQPAEGLRIDVAREQLKEIKRMAWWIEFFVSIAISATLILGGFGIWNITMTGVRARTREIGLKKAMGAEDRDILSQFLAEAVCLSLGSAAAGIALGRIVVDTLASMLDSRTPEDLFFLCVGLGLLFAVVLGIGAGLLPSVRASRMEVVSAVHYE